MSVLEQLNVDYVKDLIEEQGYTLDQAADHLRSLHPNVRGLCRRNLATFCSTNNIHRRPAISTGDLQDKIRTAVSEVGGTYGRKMMQGYLEHRFGVSVGKERIRQALAIVNPKNHNNRQAGIQNQLNPQSYHAPYFGYNLHMDQNEKIEKFGIVFVAAIDGCSNFITSYATMSRKNNVAIYRDVYKYTVESYGLFEQVVVDCGTEFALSLFVQEYLRDFRRTQRTCCKQVKSTKNNRIERWWVEQNSRVSYPIKYCFLDLEQRELADRSIPHHLFSLSEVGKAVAHYGTNLAINAWNTHSIPKHGKPIQYLTSSQTVKIPDDVMPDVEAAYDMFIGAGGSITLESNVGIDLLENGEELKKIRDEQFWNIILKEITQNSGNAVGILFGAVVNHNFVPLQHAVLRHIHLSEYLYNTRAQIP